MTRSVDIRALFDEAYELGCYDVDRVYELDHINDICGLTPLQVKELEGIIQKLKDDKEPGVLPDGFANEIEGCDDEA